VIYLHTPGGFGKSKLAQLLLNRNKLGVTVTARNHRSAVAIRALAG
jgi:guanylate kinase